MILKSILRLLFWPGVILLGILVGAGSALVMLRQASPTTGPWATGLAAGSAEADSYTRARLSLCCLLALTRKAAACYRADKDGNGDPFVAGQLHLSRHRSASGCALVEPDGLRQRFFLIETRYGLHSVNSDTVKLEDDRQYSVLVGPSPAPSAAG